MHVFLDFETRRFGKANGALPRPVCLTVYIPGQAPRILLGAEMEAALRWACETPSVELVFHNAAYDLGVAMVWMPDIRPQLWTALEQRRVHCTMIREMLLNLARTGNLRYLLLPDGGSLDISYKLVDLEKGYLGIDRSGEKAQRDSDDDDSWQVNYEVLENIPLHRWPPQAVNYAQSDAANLHPIYEKQEADPFRNFASEWIIVMRAVALAITHAAGMRIDGRRKYQIGLELAEQMSEELLSKLYAAGLLRRPIASQYYANNARGADGMRKLKAAKPAQKDTKRIQERVAMACQALGMPVRRTDPSSRAPDGNVVTDREVLKELEGADDVLDAYLEYTKLEKVIGAELPRMGDGSDRVHFRFFAMVETLRCSSRGNRKGEYDPTKLRDIGGHNIHPRVLECFLPEPEHLLLSVDFSSLELCTLCDTLVRLGFTTRYTQILGNGWDAHGYLGAQIGANIEPGFRGYLQAHGVNLMDFDAVYLAFDHLRHNSPDEAIRDRCEHLRKLAKPTGLGYPGGLGPVRFCAFAKSQYGVTVNEEMAKLLKNIWFTIFPEMRLYFRYIENTLRDTSTEDSFYYYSPSGTLRRGVDYCSACNGNALQTPAAEGAAIAYARSVRLCLDPTLQSVAYGSIPQNFRHDEGLWSVRDDGKAHLRAKAMQDCFVAGMGEIIKNAPIKTEAVLMRRWSKKAKPTFRDGVLVPWEPKA